MFFYLAKALIFIYLRVILRLNIIGAENIPKNGGIILCANHANALDALIMGVSVKRKIYFLAKKELFNNKFFDTVLKGLGGIPVDRSTSDINAYRNVLAILNRGEVLGIFSQGKRVKDAADTSSKSGVALFALKANVPVVPVGIISDYKLFSKATIKFGKPISFDEFREKKIRTEILDEVKENIMLKVFELCK